MDRITQQLQRAPSSDAVFLLVDLAQLALNQPIKVQRSKK